MIPVTYNDTVEMTLLPTRFFIPPLRPNGVRRARLVRRLEENSVARLVLVSAPAGYGKTTLVVQWVAEGAADLRFTSAEAAAFIAQSMGLQLSVEQVAALESKTEGWIAGLQMAAQQLPLEAVVCAVADRRKEALARLREAVNLAAPGGLVRAFVDEGAPLPVLHDPLSERELAILQRIAAGEKNKEIAAALFVTVNTVHYHTKNLYGNLGLTLISVSPRPND